MVVHNIVIQGDDRYTVTTIKNLVEALDDHECEETVGKGEVFPVSAGTREDGYAASRLACVVLARAAGALHGGLLCSLLLASSVSRLRLAVSHALSNQGWKRAGPTT